MITSSPCCQLTAVETLCFAVSCSESITRSTSSKLRPGRHRVGQDDVGRPEARIRSRAAACASFNESRFRLTGARAVPLACFDCYNAVLALQLELCLLKLVSSPKPGGSIDGLRAISRNPGHRASAEHPTPLRREWLGLLLPDPQPLA